MIKFENVSFAYEKGEAVISDMSFDIARGEAVGLIGANGAGKSTIMKLMLGLVTANEGRVLVDGEEVGTIFIHVSDSSVMMTERDLDFSRFGVLCYDNTNPNTYGTSLKRDRLQTKLVRKFAKANKPVLGVCRGNQVINVAFGGTLKQHIPGWHRGSRTVKIKNGTWLYKTYGKQESVSHYHHQCVKKLGKGLIATQWDRSSGLIEAIEHTQYPVWGVQWHPDHMGGRGLKVAKKFRRECLKRM